MVHEIFDLGEGNLCRALTALDIFGRRHICACGDNNVNIYEFDSKKVLHVNFPQSNGNINFAGVVAPNISNTVNPQISDLEQILLLNHTEHGLFGFSLYELIHSEEIKICGNTLHTDVHRLSPFGTNRYKIKNNRLFFASIEEKVIAIGEITLNYDTEKKGKVKENKAPPFFPYNNIVANFCSSLLDIPESTEGEDISCIEIDAEQKQMYIGTINGRIFLCKSSNDNTIKTVQENKIQENEAILIYDASEENNTDKERRRIYNLHLVHDKRRDGNVSKSLAFNRKRVEYGEDDGRIEIISNIENTAEVTASFLYTNLAVNWFYYNGQELYTIDGRKLIARDVQKDRATQKTNFNLEYSDKEDIVKADYTDRTAFGRRINCVRALILNNK